MAKKRDTKASTAPLKRKKHDTKPAAKKQYTQPSAALLRRRQKFGKVYKGLREKSPFNRQGALEKKLGVGSGYISKVENGEYPIKRNVICLEQMPYFILWGVIKTATELRLILEPMFGSIEIEFMREIAEKVRNIKNADLAYSPQKAADEFAATISKAYRPARKSKVSPKTAGAAQVSVPEVTATAEGGTEPAGSLAQSETIEPTVASVAQEAAPLDSQPMPPDAPFAERDAMAPEPDIQPSDQSILSSTNASAPAATEKGANLTVAPSKPWAYIPLVVPESHVSTSVSKDEVYCGWLEAEAAYPELADCRGLWNSVDSIEWVRWVPHEAVLSLAGEWREKGMTSNKWRHLAFNAIVDDAARRFSGMETLLPTQVTEVEYCVGRVAWEAIWAETNPQGPVRITLSKLKATWPVARTHNWSWLHKLGSGDATGYLMVDEKLCEFKSREMAECWAARYLLSGGLTEEVLKIAGSLKYPVGVLIEAARHLSFMGETNGVWRMVKEVQKNKKVPAREMRCLNAARILAASDAAMTSTLRPLCDEVTKELCLLWAKFESPAGCDQVASVMRDLDSSAFREMLLRCVDTEVKLDRWTTAVRGSAIQGGDFALETLNTIVDLGRGERVNAESPIRDGNDQPAQWGDIQAVVMAAAAGMPPVEQAMFLEAWALRDVENTDRCLMALRDAGTMPAMRALQRLVRLPRWPMSPEEITRRREVRARLSKDIARRMGRPWQERATDESAGGYDGGEFRRDYRLSAKDKYFDSVCPAHAGLIIYELGENRKLNEPLPLALVVQAGSLLQRAFAVDARQPEIDASERFSGLARELARVWADQDLDEKIRSEAAIGLTYAKAWPALPICLTTLPLLNHPEANKAPIELLPSLLMALSAPQNRAVLEAVLPQVADPAQQAVITRCLDRARE